MTARDPDLRFARFDVVAAFSVFVVAFGVLLVVSHATGPAFEELGRLADMEALEPVVLDIAARGPAALTDSDAHAALARLGDTPSLFALGAAWSLRSVGRVGLVDPLTAARLPWIAVCAVAPGLLFSWVRLARARSLALAAAALLLVMPPFLHGAVVGRPALLTATAWIAIATGCSAGRRTRGRRRVAALGCVALAAALAGATGAGALSALVLVTMQAWLADARGTLRLARSGRLAIDSGVVVGCVAAPIGWLALAPEHWGAPSIELIRSALAPLAPSIVPTLYAGRVLRELPVAHGYGAVWLACATPLAIGLAALVGVGVAVHYGLARRFASGRLRPPRDRVGLGTWAVVGIGASLLGPEVAIRPLVAFPPRVEVALPFVAIAAALGASKVGERVLGSRGRAAVAWAIVGVVGVFSLRDPGTLSAAYDGVLGPRTIQTLALLPVGDGSELARIARTAGELSVRAPEVPPGYWTALASAGMPSSIVAQAEAPYVLVRGDDPRPPVARIDRSGAVLWSIVAAR